MKLKVLYPDSNLDRHNANKLKRLIDEYLNDIASGEPPLLVINLRQVGYVCARVLEIFISTCTSMKKKGGLLCLCEVANKDVSNLMEIVGVYKAIDIYDTEKEAIEELSA